MMRHFVHFLTQIDPRAAIKGSRDPLGLQPIWTRMGREVVGNLTTVTTSTRNFTTLLLGLYFADELIAAGKADEAERAALFMKFEQLAAYSRAAYGGEEEAGRILGITRVKKRLAERGPLAIRGDAEAQILSNQKTYGIWGLYSVASVSSGLVEPDSHRVSLAARDFIEGYILPALRKVYARSLDAIRRFVAGTRAFHPLGKDRDLASALAKELSPKLRVKERAFYGRHLVLSNFEGNATGGRQARLWDVMCRVNDGDFFDWKMEFSFAELVELRKRSKAIDAGLSQALERIEIVEPLFATAARFFGYVLAQRDARADDVAQAMERTVGPGLGNVRPVEVSALRGTLAEASTKESADHLVAMAQQLASGRYRDFIDELMRLNAHIMRGRGGAAWIESRKGRLYVRLRSERSELPEASDLPTLWANTYFLNSFKRVGAEVMGKR